VRRAEEAEWTFEEMLNKIESLKDDVKLLR